MRNYISSKNGIVGFGATQEEADEDLYINMCKLDITKDTKGTLLKRRELLKPWLPRNNMLHISDRGCLVYENSALTNTKTGASIKVTKPYKSIYYYMAKLFGSTLIYTDITVVCRPEIDKFFESNLSGITLVRDTEPLKRLGTYNGFDPDVIYMLDNDLIIAKVRGSIGIKSYGEELFLVQEGSDDISSLAYAGYHLGYVITEDGIIEIS